MSRPLLANRTSRETKYSFSGGAYMRKTFQTYRRDEEGRFIVHLPVKEEQLRKIGDTQESTLKRFSNLEKKFSRQPQLKDVYVEFMREYLQLDHMREVHPEDVNVQPRYYLAHHCVLKESSTTSRLRVVFDASNKLSSSVSLNNALMCIVWRDDPEETIKTYELLTLTYGTAPVSFLATKGLQQLADLEERQFSLGAAIARRDFYMDDFITGADLIEETKMIRDQVAVLLLKGGFVLRKSISNDEKLLQDVPGRRIDNSIMELEKDGTTKTLGLKWNHHKDTF